MSIFLHRILTAFTVTNLVLIYISISYLLIQRYLKTLEKLIEIILNKKSVHNCYY